MEKKHLYHIIEWLIALAACGYLVYRLATYEDYEGLWAVLSSMGGKAYTALVLALVLMPVNMVIEAWRWETLMNGSSPMKGEGLKEKEISFREAHRQVYYSKLAGLITPWRLGEYPARGVLIKSERVNELERESVWARVLSMGTVGSATMTAAIILAGVAGLMISDFRFDFFDFRFSYLLFILLILVLLGVALYFAPQLLKRWAVVSRRLVAISIGQSMIRLLCWCLQLGLVIWALDGLDTLDALDILEKTFVYYLLVTITPNVPIAEVGVRGAWAIVVFGSMNAALAGVLLWGINTLLPCLIWPFIRKNEK